MWWPNGLDGLDGLDGLRRALVVPATTNQGALSYVYFYQCMTSALPRACTPRPAARLGLRGVRGATRPQVRARMSAPDPCDAGPRPIRARRWPCCWRSMAFWDGEARPPSQRSAGKP